MKNTIFTGAGVAIATPMHADGSINYNKLGELIDFNIDNGTDAIIICGTTGESSTMSVSDMPLKRSTTGSLLSQVPVQTTPTTPSTFLRKLRLSVQTLFFWSHLITTRPLREDLSSITQISLTQ